MIIIPNYIRAALALASAATFIPQWQHWIATKSTQGISPTYVVLNLVVAEFQLATHLVFMILPEKNNAVYSPPRTGDYLNLVQFAVVLIGHLILFLTFLAYSDRGRRQVAVFVVSAILAFAPVVFLASIRNDSNVDFAIAFYKYASVLIFTPLITILGVVSLAVEARYLQTHERAGISKLGLLLQGVVFLVVGLAWNYRMKPINGPSPPQLWYSLKGYAVVANVIFGAAQLLLWITVRGGAADPERQPLLRDEH